MGGGGELRKKRGKLILGLNGCDLWLVKTGPITYYCNIIMIKAVIIIKTGKGHFNLTAI
jgi:hypothetical protein